MTLEEALVGLLGGGTGLGDYADIQFEEGSSYYSYKIE